MALVAEGKLGEKDVFILGAESELLFQRVKWWHLEGQMPSDLEFKKKYADERNFSESAWETEKSNLYWWGEGARKLLFTEHAASQALYCIIFLILNPIIVVPALQMRKLSNYDEGEWLLESHTASKQGPKI